MLGLRISVLLLGLAALIPATIAAAYVVSPGETLSEIAHRYGVSVESLALANDMEDPDLLYAGQVLVVEPAPAMPAARRHTVTEGDTLTSIADQYRVSSEAIVAANNLDDPDHVRRGQELLIPGAASSAAVKAAQAVGRIALRQAEGEFELPRGLLLALAWQESGWNQSMVSSAGAVGLTQIMPDTADWALEVLIPDVSDWRSSPRDNARMGAAILRSYIDRSGSVTFALAAYYQGWHSVSTEGGYDETWDYVENILALVGEFQ